jgi:hypothetical protein
VKQERRPTLSIVFASFDRNLAITLPNLIENTAKPLLRKNLLTKIFIVSFGDCDDNIGNAIRLLPRQFRERISFTWFHQDAVESHSEALYQKALAFGDPWPSSKRKSLRNQVGFLWLLNQVPDLDGFPGADYVLFVRADLFQKSEVDFSRYFDYGPPGLLTPTWHEWGGLNDRVALIPKPYLEAYFRRIRNADYYILRHGPLHAEKFLHHSISCLQVDNIIEEKYYRTREPWAVVDEDFERKRGFFHRLGWASRNLMLSTIGRSRAWKSANESAST